MATRFDEMSNADILHDVRIGALDPAEAERELAARRVLVLGVRLEPGVPYYVDGDNVLRERV